MVRAKELVCEAAIKDVLANNCPSSHYQINGFCDDCACIQKTSSGWEVFNGRRGQKEGIAVFTNVVEACLELIRRLAYDEQEVFSWSEAFLSAIVGDNVA